MANIRTQKIKLLLDGVLVRGKVLRDLDAYPRPAKNTEFNDLVAARTWNITLASGRVLPAIPKPTTPPPVTNPSGLFVSYPDQGWGNADMRYMNNGTIRVGFRKSVGAQICSLLELANGQELIDDPVVDGINGQEHDKGRQLQAAVDYWTPGPNPDGYTVNGKNTKTNPDGTGNPEQGKYNTGGNGVPGGSMGPFLDEGLVMAVAEVQHATLGKLLYTKVRPRLWGVKGEYVHEIVEQWTYFANATTTAYKVRRTFENRADWGALQPSDHQSAQQENPCIYLKPDLRDHRIVVATPWTGAAGLQRFPVGYTGENPFSRPVFSTECWVGAYRNPGGKGATLYKPNESRFMTGQFDGHEASYIAGVRLMNYNEPGVYDSDEAYIITGTESEARATINTLPRPNQAFDFTFDNDSHNWWNSDCRLRKQNGQYFLNWGDRKTDINNGSLVIEAVFSSPYRAWVASGITQISFDLTVTGTTEIDLIWEKAGVLGEVPRHAKRFTVIGDGQRRTYTVNTASENWNGILATIGIKVVPSVTQESSIVTPYRIYKP